MTSGLPGKRLPTGTVILDTEVSVLVRFGPNRVFSGGLVVTLDCPTPPPTPDEPTTTTTEPVTVPPAPPAPEVPGEQNFTG